MEKSDDKALESLRQHISNMVSSKEIVSAQEARALPSGKFDVKGVKKLINQTNNLYNSIQLIFNRKGIHSKVIGSELTHQLLQKYPDIMAYLKHAIDEQYHLQKDWITLQFENLQSKLQDRYESESQSLAFLDEQLQQYEEKQTKDTVVSSIKFLWASKVKGQAMEAPKKEFLSFAQVVAAKFEQRIMMKLQFAGQGQASTDMPNFITDELKGLLVGQIQELKHNSIEFIKHLSNKSPDYEETKDSTNGISMSESFQPIAQLTANSSVDQNQVTAGMQSQLSLMDSLLLSDDGGRAHLQVVQRIGTVDERLGILARVLKALYPIWESRQKVTKLLVHRVGKSLCPELFTQANLDENYERQIGSFIKIVSGETQPMEHVGKVDFKLELILCLFLPICGIDLPFTKSDTMTTPYREELDKERAWTREVKLRILMLNDQRKASMYLSSFEQKFAEWLAKNVPQCTQFSLEQFERNGSVSENTVTVDITNYLTTVFNTDRMPDISLPNSSVQLRSLIEGQQKCQIEQIYVPESKQHRHVFIAIAGFLSQSKDNADYWIHLKNFCRVRGMPFFAVRWESKDDDFLEHVTRQQADKNNVSQILQSTNQFSDLLSTDKIKKLASFSQDLYREALKTFKQARRNAKTTGKMLAHFLVASRRDIFGDHTFSLLGFSLGSQVCKSCINRLAQLGCSDLIHNVYFLAGATYTTEKKLALQADRFKLVLNGRAVNIKTKNDTSLSGFQYIYKVDSYGRNTYFQNDMANQSWGEVDEFTQGVEKKEHEMTKEERMASQHQKLYRFDNYDVSTIIQGHLEYSKKLDLVLDYIHFQF